ncbi:MAG: S41 family peptidase [Candidatus Schekmanbacteria bacterium]|nr:S41 family peptidase [Candidatus Schekmanbacteria bacterium]
MFFRNRKSKFVGVSIALSLILLIGLSIAGQGVVSDKDDSYKQLKTFTEVLRLVENNYVEEVENKELYYGAIRGMLNSLDSHSAFMPPEIYKEMQVETKGSFGGLGIEITIRKNRLTVVAPIEGTPADSAGIKPGDWIVQVNGEFTKDMTLMDAVNKMRGPKGTSVTIGIMRDGFDKPKDFVLVRDVIQIKNISFNMADEESKIGYIRLRQFQERSDEEVENALTELKKQGMQGLILDMRNNPGGLLDMAIAVSGKFLPKGKLVVSTKGRVRSQNREYNSLEEPGANDYPMIVLVNAGSASAAEIVAGAIQDWNRGVLLGEKTFGKGSVQTVIQLNDGSGLRLTTARYYTPKGTSIHAKGIVPDITVADGELVKDKENHPVIREKDLRQIPGSPDQGDEGTGLENEQPEPEIEPEPPAEPIGKQEPDKPGEKAEEGKEGQEKKKADIQLERAIQILKANKIFAKGLSKETSVADKK